MDRLEYMKMPIHIFLEHIIQQYNLRNKAKQGFVYLEIRKAIIYGLQAAGRPLSQQLQEKLCPAGYHQVTRSPGLWKRVTRPMQFTAVVDDFGVKYVVKRMQKI